MEAGDGAAGDGDEHEGPDGSAGGMLVAEVLPQLRHHIVAGEEHGAGNAQSHDDQADAEDGVQLADDLVDGNEGGDHIVDHDDPQPEGGVQMLGGQHGQQTGGAGGEDDTAHDQQDHGEHTHDLAHTVAQVVAGQLGDGSAAVAHGQHTAEVVMDSTGEDTAEDDPQVSDGAEQGTAQSAQDGAGAGDVQQLDQKDLPGGHGDVVNAVLHGIGGSLTIIGTEDLGHVLAVEHIAHEQQHDTENEGNHRVSSLNSFSRQLPLPIAFIILRL